MLGLGDWGGIRGYPVRVAPTREIHLENQYAPEALLTGVVSEGEFHEIVESAFEALLTGVTPTREIHL